MKPLQSAHAAWVLCALLAGCQGSDVTSPADDVGTPADADAGVTASAAPFRPAAALTPEAAWGTPLSIPLVVPTDFGAVTNDDADDTDALIASVNALPAEGGIVLLPQGTLHKLQRRWRIEKDHVLLWAPNGRATIAATTRPRTQAEKDARLCGPRQIATVFRRVTGGGVFGVKFVTVGTERTSCPDDSSLYLDSVDGLDIVGVDATGATGAGIFVGNSSSAQADPSRNVFAEGNKLTRSWADSLHTTQATRRVFAWRNIFFNDAPSLGDDGIACVTYGPTSPKCGEMEWWDNFYMGGMHGRGFAVIGGEDVLVHHNWVFGSASAALIVGSEDFYDSASAQRITFRDNWVIGSPNLTVNNGHPSLLITGGNPRAEPLNNITASNNVIIPNPPRASQRISGLVDAATVVAVNSNDPALLPSPQPTLETVAVQDTTEMRTRDTSFVPEVNRKGLFRVHVRLSGERSTQQRLEYVISGSRNAIRNFSNAARNMNAYVSETREVGNRSYALILSPVPLLVGRSLEPVTFDQLRAGDRDGTLSWLWARIDKGQY